MLNILEPVQYENSVLKKEFRSYLPYNDNSFNANDEIRISVNNFNFVLLNESHIHFEIKVTSTTPAEATLNLNDNFIPFLFSEIRLEMNGIPIDSVKTPGICASVLNYLTSDAEEKNAATLQTWPGDLKKGNVRDFIVPLRYFLNFANDYKNVIIFSRLELILVRARNDDNAVKMAIVGGVKGVAKLGLEKIRWFVPHIHPEESLKLKMLKILEHGRQISMPFRSVEYHENPGITGTDISWQVKTTTSRPLYVIVGFQTDKKDNTSTNATEFDHCSLRNCRLFLNSDVFPYEALNVDYENEKFAIPYKMLQDCRKSFCDKNGSSITRDQFKSKAPLICFDISNYDTHLKNAITDVRLVIQLNSAAEARTSINLLIISEEIIHYNPFTSIVQKE